LTEVRARHEAAGLRATGGVFIYMRYSKRLTMVVALAVAGAVALAGVALAANVQTFTAKTTAKDGAFGTNQPLENAKVFVKVTTEDDAGAVVPDPVTRARIGFDKQIAIDNDAVQKCNRTLIENTTTAQAKTACPGSRVVGQGHAIARTAGGTNLPATVTAFNGQPEGSDPADWQGTVLLHTYIPAAGTTVVLKGYLRDGTVGGAACGAICTNRSDLMLDVTVPGLPGVVLVSFDTTVTKLGFVQGHCNLADGKMKYKSLWNYQSNPDIIVNKTHNCV
jgi:hypothetical protein